MAGTIKDDGAYVLSQRTEALEGFEQELESSHLVGEWQIPRRPEPLAGGVPYLWKWNTMLNMMRQAVEVLGLEEGGGAASSTPIRESPRKGRPFHCAPGSRC